MKLKDLIITRDGEEIDLDHDEHEIDSDSVKHVTADDLQAVDKVNGKRKANDVATLSRMKAKSMNPIATKQTNPRQAGTRPYDPSSGLGGEDHGTGLVS